MKFVGVIGAGVSGRTAAYLLAKAGHHVTLYEADDRLGGHADTHEVSGPDGRPMPSTPASSSTTSTPIHC